MVKFWIQIVDNVLNILAKNNSSFVEQKNSTDVIKKTCRKTKYNMLFYFILRIV